MPRPSLVRYWCRSQFGRYFLSIHQHETSIEIILKNVDTKIIRKGFIHQSNNTFLFITLTLTLYGFNSIDCYNSELYQYFSKWQTILDYENFTISFMYENNCIAKYLLSTIEYPIVQPKISPSSHGKIDLVQPPSLKLPLKLSFVTNKLGIVLHSVYPIDAMTLIVLASKTKYSDCSVLILSRQSSTKYSVVDEFSVGKATKLGFANDFIWAGNYITGRIALYSYSKKLLLKEKIICDKGKLQNLVVSPDGLKCCIFTNTKCIILFSASFTVIYESQIPEKFLGCAFSKDSKKMYSVLHLKYLESYIYSFDCSPTIATKTRISSIFKHPIQHLGLENDILYLSTYSPNFFAFQLSNNQFQDSVLQLEKVLPTNRVAYFLVDKSLLFYVVNEKSFGIYSHGVFQQLLCEPSRKISYLCIDSFNSVLFVCCSDGCLYAYKNQDSTPTVS